MKKIKSQLETEISESIIKFEKEYMGRGPEETKTIIFDDNIFIRLRGVLTPAEKKLASTDESRGRDLIKQVRLELIEKARPLLDTMIFDITGTKVKSLHTDISTTSGERIIVFTLEKKMIFD